MQRRIVMGLGTERSAPKANAPKSPACGDPRHEIAFAAWAYFGFTA